MKNSTPRFDLVVYIMFLALIIVSVFNVFYSSYVISKNRELTKGVVESHLPSIQILEKLSATIEISRIYSKNIVTNSNDFESRNRLSLILKVDLPEVLFQLNSVSDKWTMHSNLANKEKIIADIRAITDQYRMILSLSDNYGTKAISYNERLIKIQDSIDKEVSNISLSINKLSNLKKLQADLSNHEMDRSSWHLFWGVLGIASLIIVIVILYGYFFTNNILKPVLSLRDSIIKISKGELPGEIVVLKKNVIGQISEAVMQLKRNFEATTHFANKIGAGDFQIQYTPSSTKDMLGNSLIRMRDNLYKYQLEADHRKWEDDSLSEINKIIRTNSNNTYDLFSKITFFLKNHFRLQNVNFLFLEDPVREYFSGIRFYNHFTSEQMLIDSFQTEQARIKECLINLVPMRWTDSNKDLEMGGVIHHLLIPIIHQQKIFGVVEFQSEELILNNRDQYIEKISDLIGSTILFIITINKTKTLLKETENQAANLKDNEEKLKRINQLLQSQTDQLHVSREEIKSQNGELANKASLLKEQNEILEETKDKLSMKAAELEKASKYKSEFLANISHELRTPLNSILVLANLLNENKNKLLSAKEVEYARVIIKSGNELLNLINDLLDIEKIESGKFEIIFKKTLTNEIRKNMFDLFNELALQRKIDFSTDLHSSCPDEFISDQFRLEQVLKNLISNAIKFTPIGGKVSFVLKNVNTNKVYQNLSSDYLRDQPTLIEISVADTGVGIPLEKQKLIFESFRQEDGTTSRKYGGTGLGLSISKSIVHLLGGEIVVKSSPESGSIFSVFLPVKPKLYQKQNSEPSIANLNIETIKDDRNNIFKNDRVCVCIEPNIELAKTIYKNAHDNRVKIIFCSDPNKILSYANSEFIETFMVGNKMSDHEEWKVALNMAEKSGASIITYTFDNNETVKSESSFINISLPLDVSKVDKIMSLIKQNEIDRTPSVLYIGENKTQFEILTRLFRQVEVDMQIISLQQLLESEKDISELGHNYTAIIADLDSETINTDLENRVIKLLSNNNKSGIVLFRFTRQGKAETHDCVLLNSGDDESFKKLFTISKNKKKHGQQGFESSSSFYYRRNIQKLKGKKILIYDSDISNAYLMLATFEKAGIKAKLAINARELYSRLNESAGFDWILLSASLHDEEKKLALDILSNSASWNNIPVLFFSNNDNIKTSGESYSLSSVINKMAENI